MHNYNSKKYKYYKTKILIYLINEFSRIKNTNFRLINKERYTNENYIIAEFDIKGDNQNIRIINSYDEANKSIKDIFKNTKNYENEKEIKENCEIRINDELIPFSYFHIFNKKGKHRIKYTFMVNMKKVNYLFKCCYFLTDIDLSKFNGDNIINMKSMFDSCINLKNINLTNFNTHNVKDMRSLFHTCKSLTSLNLSNLNTNNVIDMGFMFCQCLSLTKLDLFNFNTNNVKSITRMFSGCSSLTNIDLSNFNTNNVIDMAFMFYQL